MRIIILSLVLPGLAACAPAGRTAGGSLRAGAYAMDVTPENYPISVNGGMSDRQATGAHDPLHARCLVLDDGRSRLAIAVVDSCMIPRDILDAAKERASKATGIPTSRMLVSATHTHTAPTVTGVFQSDPDEGYRKFLAAKIAEGIKEANDRLAPAEIGWAVGHEPNEVFVRRWILKEGITYEDPFGRKRDRIKMNPRSTSDKEKPAAPIDPQVPILAVRTREGKPVAALVNYSLHYVGGVRPLSADYFGAFAKRFAELIGEKSGNGPFVAILSNGTSGDINNVNYALKTRPKRGPYEQIERVADAVAKAAHKAWTTISYRRDVTLAMSEEEVELGVRMPSVEDITAAKGILKAAGDRVLKGYKEVYARETVLLAEYPPTVKLKLQALRIGDVGITAIPCETFVEIGRDLKRRSPLQPSFTIELANGYNGYLPTERHHRMGGYETWRARSSYLEMRAAHKITGTLMRLLREVAKK